MSIGGLVLIPRPLLWTVLGKCSCVCGSVQVVQALPLHKLLCNTLGPLLCRVGRGLPSNLSFPAIIGFVALGNPGVISYQVQGARKL